MIGWLYEIRSILRYQYENGSGEHGGGVNNLMKSQSGDRRSVVGLRSGLHWWGGYNGGGVFSLYIVMLLVMGICYGERS